MPLAQSSQAGGLNAEDGFPLYFTEVSRLLGRYDQTEADIDSICHRYPPTDYPRALDICCGLGRAAAALVKRGYHATGIDLSREQIAEAGRVNPGPTYLQGDMACLPPGPYDLMLNLYTSFGYCGSEGQDIALLYHWTGALRAGGLLIMELADMDRARSRLPPDGRLERETDGVTEILSMDWRQRLLTVDYHHSGREWRCVTRLYEKEALAQHLLAAGFHSVEMFGSFRFGPKQPGDNLVLVAMRET